MDHPTTNHFQRDSDVQKTAFVRKWHNTTLHASMLTHMAHIIFTDARKKLNGVAICTAECRFAWIRNIWTRCGVRWSSRACLPHSFTVAEQGPLYGRVQASILCTMFFIGLVHHHHHHYHYHKGKVATYRYGITVELHVFVALVAAAGVVPLRFHSICCHRLECANGSGKTKGCSKRTNHLIAEKNTLVFPTRTDTHYGQIALPRTNGPTPERFSIEWRAFWKAKFVFNFYQILLQLSGQPRSPYMEGDDDRTNPVMLRTSSDRLTLRVRAKEKNSGAQSDTQDV